MDHVAHLNQDHYDRMGHVASPDVWIDEKTREIRMYFHFRLLNNGHRGGYAVSKDGIHFRVSPGALGRPHMRHFAWKGQEYTLDRD